MVMLDSSMLGEVTLRSGPATLWRGVEPIAGTLTLTHARLRFEGKAGLLQGGALSIPLADIVRVELASTAFVVPNRIVVVRRDGRKHVLTLADRDGWAARIRSLQQMRT